MKKLWKLIGIFLIGMMLFVPVQALGVGESETITFPESYRHQGGGSSDYLIYYGLDNAYNYNPETNTFEKIYSADRQICNIYTRGDITYIWHENNSTSSYVTAYNLKSKKEDFTALIERQGVVGGSFVVDLHQRIYFRESSENAISIYNKDGSLYKKVTTDQAVSRVNDFSPNDEYLFVDINSSSEGTIKLNNQELEKGNVYKNYANRYPRWKFTSDKTIAVNQYGEVVKFNYSNENPTYEFLSYAITGTGYASYPSFYETSDMLYLPSKDGYLIGLNKSDYSKKNKILIKENNRTYFVFTRNNSVYAFTYGNGAYSNTRVNLSNKIEAKHIVINTHKTLNYTKDQITKKYNDMKPKYDYSKTVYNDLPSTTIPYKEGSLKDEVVTDTLNQLNYYRWLVGIPSIGLNADKQSRNQKGALVLAINKVLTHTPTQPEGMDDDFYKEAYAGCNAGSASGDFYQGNASQGSLIVNDPKEYIDDSSNLSPNVGHRSSMLNLYATQTSFGYVNGWGTMSIYVDLSKEVEEKFYAWPPAGNVPVESFPQYTKTKWSIWLDDSISVTNDSIVVLTYNNKDYTISGDSLYYSSSYSSLKTVYFDLPGEIRGSLLNGAYGGYNVAPGTSVHVTLKNLKDDDINTYEVSYDVNFFSIEKKEITGLFLTCSSTEQSKYTSANNGGTLTLYNGLEYTISPTKTPSDAKIGVLEYKVEDESIVTFDSSKKRLIPKKTGTTKLTVTDPESKKEFTYTLKVQTIATKVSFKEDKIKINIGEHYKLNPIIEPSGAILQSAKWSISNSSIAYVNSDGDVVGLNVGSATITLSDNSNSSLTPATITVEVVNEARSISLNRTSLTLAEKDSATLTVVFNPNNVADKEVTWTSSNPSVATVSNGKVTGVKEGKTTITATTKNGKTATCEVEIVFKLPFKDTNVEDWYYNSVKFAYQNKIIMGYSDTQFAPNDKVTRGQLVTILWRYEGTPDTSTIKNKFSDVPENDYFTSAVKWAESKEIIHGYNAKKFGPNDPITRQDLAVILNNFAKYKGLNAEDGEDISSFADYSKVKGSYSEPALKWAVKNKVMSGQNINGKKYVSPTNNATRAETAAMVTNFINTFN